MGCTFLTAFLKLYQYAAKARAAAARKRIPWGMSLVQNTLDISCDRNHSSST